MRSLMQRLDGCCSQQDCCTRCRFLQVKDPECIADLCDRIYPSILVAKAFCILGKALQLGDAITELDAVRINEVCGECAVALLTEKHEVRPHDLWLPAIVIDDTTRNGTPLGNVISAEVTYSNGLDRIETIRSDGRIDGADPSIAALTGRIVVRFADQTLVTQAINGESCEIEFAYPREGPGSPHAGPVRSINYPAAVTARPEPRQASFAALFAFWRDLT